MSDVIRLLPDSVANQIAAGEVIQRPASVVKELVENAVDAGATHIQIVLQDAGRTLIQIIDNGKGMSQTDARMSFERHATSKIDKADDLFALTTKGFRGEALASIAAVAQVELRTRTSDEEVGTLLEVAASKVTRQEVISCPQGANFAVKNLFYNIPARRKFLKADKTELSHILVEFQRIALVHPDIAFTLKANEQTLLDLPVARQKARITQIFGKRLTSGLIPLERETPFIKMSGFMGTVGTARKRGAETYFFANGRYMRHPYFHKAITEAYSRLVPEGEQVPYFLYFTVSPTDIDVNIHPTKTEIKFEHEQAIWQILLATVKETLGKHELVPMIDFDTTDRFDIPVAPARGEERIPVQEPTIEFNPDYNPFQIADDRINHTSRSSSESSSNHRMATRKYSSHNFDNLGHLSTNSNTDSSSVNSNSFDTTEPITPALFPEQETQAPEVGYCPVQIKGRYIMVSVRSGLMLIDARQAHIRILFDHYHTLIETRKGAGQQLLFPEMVELSPVEEAILSELLPELEGIGFDLSALGGGSYAINAIPVEHEGTSPLSPVGLLTDLIHVSIENGKGIASEMRKEIALALSRAAAIVHGQALSDSEMKHLIDTLFLSSQCSHTPDGKPVFVILRNKELERLFL